ncbi:PASTA domain-containing protein [Nonomuraea sp. NPDC050556]|uniref:PASTA domain-containing protein n=1 Tax=Nonomuraea sp. NPDC050556 TaxID=3364369 RepID=UPI0037B1F366
MNAEEALREAMAEHVSGVQAPPTLGRAVRRSSRAHTIRFRTAGVALVTAAVAVTVPIALTSGEPVASGTDRAVVSVTVPDVEGMDVKQATAALERLGLAVESDGEGTVDSQTPAAGTEVAPATKVVVTVASALPQDLGDLGDGRTFGGIHLGYLPDGLVWGKWSGKDGFGKTSYTTTFDEPDAKPGYFSIQVVVYEGEAAAPVLKRLADDDEHAVEVDGERMFLAWLGEASQPLAEGEGGTATIERSPRDGLLVQIMMSPTLEAKLGKEAAVAELKRIAKGVSTVK